MAKIFTGFKKKGAWESQGPGRPHKPAHGTRGRPPNVTASILPVKQTFTQIGTGIKPLFGSKPAWEVQSAGRPHKPVHGTRGRPPAPVARIVPITQEIKNLDYDKPVLEGPDVPLSKPYNPLMGIVNPGLASAWAKRKEMKANQEKKEDALVQGRGTQRAKEDRHPYRPSSNVEAIGYDDASQTLVIEFHSGAIYVYYNIGHEISWQIRQGAAVCRTEGQNQWGAWYVGKSPSLGAAVWTYLRQPGIEYKMLVGPSNKPQKTNKKGKIVPGPKKTYIPNYLP